MKLTPSARRRRLARRSALFGAFALALGTLVPSSQAYDWYPGLPDATHGNWSNISQGGMAYTNRAKQWFRAPVGMVTTEYSFSNISSNPDYAQYRSMADSYVVSPAGAPENYGYLAPMTVRSVGFGLMPVEATVQVSQRRRNGLPVPFHVVLPVDYDHERLGPGQPVTREDIYYREFSVEDSLDVRVLAVRVDGEDMRLNGDCRTEEPAPFKVTSPEYVRYDTIGKDEAEWFRTNDPETYFHPVYGGQLRGEITIPPFTGCTTASGDDLSDLITLAASGPDNPMIARAGYPFGCLISVGPIPAPLPPGKSTPKAAGCPGPKPFVYPARDDD